MIILRVKRIIHAVLIIPNILYVTSYYISINENFILSVVYLVFFQSSFSPSFYIHYVVYWKLWQRTQCFLYWKMNKLAVCIQNFITSILLKEKAWTFFVCTMSSNTTQWPTLMTNVKLFTEYAPSQKFVDSFWFQNTPSNLNYMKSWQENVFIIIWPQ